MAKAKIINIGIKNISDKSFSIKSFLIAGSNNHAIDDVLAATSIAKNTKLKREYEEKFANIEATSKLHETKQQKLNKRLMEWCTK